MRPWSVVLSTALVVTCLAACGVEGIIDGEEQASERSSASLPGTECLKTWNRPDGCGCTVDGNCASQCLPNRDGSGTCGPPRGRNGQCHSSADCQAGFTCQKQIAFATGTCQSLAEDHRECPWTCRSSDGSHSTPSWWDRARHRCSGGKSLVSICACKDSCYDGQRLERTSSACRRCLGED